MAASSFRKQIQRVRQNIDQNLGRAEKTEVLSEEELNLERRVELLKMVCQNIQKKLVLCVKSPSQITETDKRLKKIPEHGLWQTLKESSVQLTENTPSSQIFDLASGLQHNLATEIIMLDILIENNSLKFLQNILENDYPAIQKLKKQLNTKTLDMDAAKARFYSAQKQYQAGTVPQQKVDETKIEYEDAITRVETIRDQLATEMYSFSSKEVEINQSLLELVEAQAEFLRKSLTYFDRAIPRIKECFDFSVHKPVFGQSLSEHVEKRGSRDIALVLEECVQFLHEHALEEEGLFRLAGSSSKIKKLKSAFNSNISSGSVIAGVDEVDVNVIASVLKQYLRELPDPLMTCDLYNEWMKANELPADQVANYLKDVAAKLPRINYANLRYLIKFLKKLSECSDVNKMSPANIGLVMGPNLIWAAGDVGPNMLTTGMQSSLVEMLVVHANTIFPGEINFTTSSNESPETNFVFNKLSAISQNDPSIHVKQQQYNILPSYSSQPDNKRSEADVSNSTTPQQQKQQQQVQPPQQQQQISLQTPASTTIKRSKKQQAPQPPPDGSLVTPFQHLMTTSEYTPVTRLVEKPRVPPPERPTMPPPDKPVRSSNVEQQVAAPAPGFILPATLKQQSQQVAPQVQTMPQPLLPDVAMLPSHAATTTSYQYNSDPHQQQQFTNNNSNSSSDFHVSSPYVPSAPLNSGTNQQQHQPQQRISLTSPSVLSSSSFNQSSSSTPPPSSNIPPKPNYPYLGPSENPGAQATSGSPKPAPKTHSRNSSLGSKPPPPRPHPPLPPKRFEQKPDE